MPSATTTLLKLTKAEMNALNQPVNGQGGHQSFLRKLQGKLDPESGELALSDAEIGQIVRHVAGYGDGGFQGRLREAFRRSLREALT